MTDVSNLNHHRWESKYHNCLDYEIPQKDFILPTSQVSSSWLPIYAFLFMPYKSINPTSERASS
jgi:hypothetical protein